MSSRRGIIEQERDRKENFCLSAQSHADTQSVITHRLSEVYSTVSLPGDDQEERKNDTQLKTIVMLLEMIDRERKNLPARSLSLPSSIEVECLLYYILYRIDFIIIIIRLSLHHKQQEGEDQRSLHTSAHMKHVSNSKKSHVKNRLTHSQSYD